MRLYGKKTSLEMLPAALEEVTLVVTKAEVEQLIVFLEKCASEMDDNAQWEHAHFNDHASGGGGGGLIVFSEDAMARL